MFAGLVSALNQRRPITVMNLGGSDGGCTGGDLITRWAPSCSPAHALKIVRHPVFPIAMCADALQYVVVVSAIPLEVQAEIPISLHQRPIGTHDHGDQQSTDASVAFKKRMKGLRRSPHQVPRRRSLSIGGARNKN